jgi:glycosyltransferase involved in cell wall biosynthesis
VLTQSYSNIELIVVDDSSSDNTELQMLLKQKSDKRLRFFRNTANLGACASRNKAIDAAQGEFITGLDDDDYFLPDRIESFVNLWSNKKHNVVALTSGYLYCITDVKYKKSQCIEMVTLEQIYLKNIVGSQAFMPTEIAIEAGAFDPDLLAWQDLDFFIRLLAKGDIQNSMEYSYVVDTSHPHERITTQNYRNIRSSCEYIIQKYNLNHHQKIRLRSQLLAYKLNPLTVTGNILSFLSTGDVDGLRSVSSRVLRTLKLRRD